MIDIQWQPYTRVQLLQHLVDSNNYKTYLEIGCDKNQVFGNITVEYKEGVDPKRGGTQQMTSDEFFAQDIRTWDLIFIDGLHTYKQVCADVDNALARLNPGGSIVIHDMLPLTPEQAGPAPVERYWLGDVWRLAFDLSGRSDLNFHLFKFDFGCGIVTHGVQTPLKGKSDSTWKFYEKNYKRLPLITFEEYFKHAPIQS
jgi:hypothetical protein